MSDRHEVEGDADPAREMTPEQRAAMERATLQLQADIAALLADPAYRAARGPTYAERREAAAAGT